MANPNRKGKVNARTRARPQVGTKYKAVAANNARLTMYRKKFKEWLDKGMDVRDIDDIVKSVNGKYFRAFLIDAPKPPKVVLPVRKSTKGVAKLNSELANEICEQLQRGAGLSLVAAWVGVTPHMLARWLKMEGEPYATFQEAVKRSLAYAEMNAINAFRMQNYFDGHSAEKYLKLRYPEKYNPNPTPNGLSVTFDLGSFLEQAWEEARGAVGQKQKRAEKALTDGEILEGEVVKSEGTKG